MTSQAAGTGDLLVFHAERKPSSRFPLLIKILPGLARADNCRQGCMHRNSTSSSNRVLAHPDVGAAVAGGCCGGPSSGWSGAWSHVAVHLPVLFGVHCKTVELHSYSTPTPLPPEYLH